MAKIEVMTEDEILALLMPFRVDIERGWGLPLVRLIMTWATAKAEAERQEFYTDHKFSRYCHPSGVNYCQDKRHELGPADYLAAVLKRIGWPDDKAPGAGEDKDL